MFHDITRKRNMEGILRDGHDYSVIYLRIDIGPFLHLVFILHDKHLLIDSRHRSVEEQLAIFLNVVGNNTKNMTMRVEFLRSGEIISSYFNTIL